MPRKEEDRSLHGAPYGTETEQAAAQASAGPAPAAKPVVAPVQWTEPPDMPMESVEPEIPQEEISTPDLDIEGMGNLADVLFSETDRPGEDPNTQPAAPTIFDPPMGPPDTYLEMLHDPAVSENTKAIIRFVAQMRLMQPR